METLRRKVLALLSGATTIFWLSVFLYFTPFVGNVLGFLAENLYKDLLDRALKHHGACTAECMTVAWHHTYGWLVAWQNNQDLILVPMVLSVTLVILSLLRLRWICERVGESGFRPSLYTCLFAQDIDAWVKKQEGERDRQNRLLRRGVAKGMRAHRIQTRNASRLPSVPVVDLRENRMQRIEELCGDLLRITPVYPPDLYQQSESVCAQARQKLAGGKFNEARELLVAVYRVRKEENKSQKVKV